MTIKKYRKFEKEQKEKQPISLGKDQRSRNVNWRNIENWPKIPLFISPAYFRGGR